MSVFEDTSTDCAICLEPLYDNDDDNNEEEEEESEDGSSQEEGNSTSGRASRRRRRRRRRVITLSCGHKWHYDCLLQQIQTAKPSLTKRLLLTGCQCAKCGTICSNHPDLLDNVPVARATDELRQKVDVLLREQIALDAPDVWKMATVSNNSNMDGNSSAATPATAAAQLAILDDARRKYAFYLCRHCHEPYFGGTVECADSVSDNGNNNPQEQQEERLCPACSPQSQVSCQNPLEHRGHLVWKCRYCCQPATHLCYGNVHFCDDCHDRNSQRVRALSSSTPSGIPPPLTAVPCSGDDCPFPKEEGQTHHSNGATKDCEQVYGCAWCQSVANHRQGLLGQDQQQQQQTPGSTNLLSNPSGQLGLRGWVQRNPRMSWQVEASDDWPVNAETATNFVSSYLPCIMTQTLDLTHHLAPPPLQQQQQQHHQNEPNVHGSVMWNCRLEVSARFTARTDCPSVFRLEAIVSNANYRPLQRLATPILDAPPDYWDRARLVLDDVPMLRTAIATTTTITTIGDDNNNDNEAAAAAARFVTIAVTGKDGRFWRGNFGSKVADCSIRVLGTPEELARVMIAPAASQQQQQQNERQQQSNETGNNNDRLRLLVSEAILPLACFVFLFWLLFRA